MLSIDPNNSSVNDFLTIQQSPKRQRFSPEFFTFSDADQKLSSEGGELAFTPCVSTIPQIADSKVQQATNQVLPQKEKLGKKQG